MAGEPLAEESRTYQAGVKQWAEEHDGEFVLIRGPEAVGGTAGVLWASR